MEVHPHTTPSSLPLCVTRCSLCFKLGQKRLVRFPFVKYSDLIQITPRFEFNYCCPCAPQVVVTVFAETIALSPVPASVVQDSDTEDGEGPTLTFNLYCPKLSQSADIDLPDAVQKMMTGEMDFRPTSPSLTFVEGNGILMMVLPSIPLF